MIRIDFDQPSYLRASKGLAILSARMQHLLPDETEHCQDNAIAEPLIINRLYSGLSSALPAVVEPHADSAIKGEFLPHIEESDPQNDAAETSELNFGGIKGKSVTGEYGGSGYAAYRFNKKYGKSFFVRVGKHLIWGIELAPELRRLGAVKGQEITITFLGKQPVTVLKEAMNGQGEPEWINTHKNLWDVKAVC